MLVPHFIVQKIQLISMLSRMVNKNSNKTNFEIYTCNNNNIYLKSTIQCYNVYKNSRLVDFHQTNKINF